MRPEKVRVTIDMTPQFNERLESLESLVEGSSKAEVIRQALQLYEYVAKRIMDGYSFQSVSKDGKRENLIFLLGSSKIVSPE